MTIRNKKIISFVAAILSIPAVTSCVSDDGEPTPQPTDRSYSITFNISAASPSKPTTRATDNFTDTEIAETSTAANELINNWVLAFIRDNNIVAIADGKPGSGGTSGASGVWNDRVNIELPRGTYSAVAFANMDVTKLKDHLGNLDFSGDWKNHVYDETLTASDNSLIPMSGYLEDFTVQGSVNEEFAIEVVRMKVKIEYAIKNLSSEKIQIISFSMTPVYTGPIFLFPEYDKKPVPDTQEPVNGPRLPASEADAPDPYIKLEEQARTNFVLDANSDKLEHGNFYIKESIATGNHPTDHFHIGLKLKRCDSAAEDVSYALADDALKFIYRNDHILFPIVITDYVPEFEVIDFPPIGGYPVRLEAVNNEFYATFSNSGAFDISARLRDSRGKTVAILPYDGTDTQENYVRYLGSISPEDFELTYEPTLATWQGNFPQGSNRHIILKFEFKIGHLIYIRTLHLISK